MNSGNPPDAERERTLVLLKPDAVRRSLIGEIISRLERAGLKIFAMKMLQPTRAIALAHYDVSSEEWVTNLGRKTIESFTENNLNIKDKLGFDDPYEIGKMVHGWLIDYISSGPIVAMVLEGPNAVQSVRKLIGYTIPIKANPGTIRGDFSTDSPTVANFYMRSIKNLVHASGNLEEAHNEIAIWFKPEEIINYHGCD